MIDVPLVVRVAMVPQAVIRYVAPAARFAGMVA
jgi:hypothetical protein